MSHPFEYRKPTTEEVALMATFNDHAKATYESLLVVAKPSAERTLAIRKLQEARMWANVAILGIRLTHDA